MQTINDSYPGGKRHIYKQLINKMPPHQQFISLFMGHCPILRFKKPATVNIGIDKDSDVVERWQKHKAQLPDPNHTWVLSNQCSLRWLSRNVSDPGNSNINQDTLIYADPPYIHDTRLTARC